MILRTCLAGTLRIPTFRYVGNDATVAVSPQGNMVTSWATKPSRGEILRRLLDISRITELIFKCDLRAP